MTSKIAIIGAGPAGLTLARLLHLSSINFTIFERDPNPAHPRQGGSLDIHEGSGQLALETCGLMDEFRATARYDAQELKATDSRGNILLHEEVTEGMSKSPEIDRKQLRDILLRSVPAEMVTWGAVVDGIGKGEDGKMEVNMVGGEVIRGFELVVGADGAWSKVRKMITDATPKYSGFYYLQSDIKPTNSNYDAIASLVGPGSLVSMGQSRQIACQPLAGGLYNTYICLRLPEHWGKTDQTHRTAPNETRKQLLENEFADWAEHLKAIIRSSEGPLHAWPLYAMPTTSLSWQTVPGITLIGDAAHCSTPFVGEGVNCSMYDSLQLAQAIDKHGVRNLNSAVAEYEKRMFPRGIDLITRSAGSQQVILAEDAPTAFKAMLEAAGGELKLRE